MPIPFALTAQGRVTGVVFDSLRTNAPLAGAMVMLEGVEATAVTDERGRFVIADVKPGRYVATFFHPWLDSIRTSAPVRVVEVGDRQPTTLMLSTPSWRTVSNRLCRSPLDSATAVVMGRARAAEDGRALEGARARVEWFEITIGMMEGLQRGRRVLEGRTDADGEFILCGVPNDVEIEMHVTIGEQSTGPVDLALRNQPIAWRDVAVSLTDPAARIADPTAGDSANVFDRAPGSARARVRVRDASGQPVSGAFVGVRGAPVAGRTNAEGSVFLPGLPAGSQTFVVRSIGAMPTTRVADLVPARDTPLEIVLERAPPELAAVTVHGVRESPEVAAFQRRRRSGGGYFLDGDDLRRGAGTRLLATVPGITMRQDGLGGAATPMFREPGGALCRPDVLVDGAPRLSVDAWELNLLLGQAVRVEVYTRRLLVPGELMALGSCGLIGIWTR